jgi:hypothetical protein
MSENSLPPLPQIPPPSLSNKATLEYLTNPYYQNVLNARNKKKTLMNKEDEVDKKDISFYRKRIVALTKDMLKGIEPPFPNEDIKKIYEDYVKNLINYFKMIDRKDILQDQYDKVILDEDDTSMNANANANAIDANSIEDINDALKQIQTINYEKADELMMKKTIRVSNLDDFVVILKNEDEKNDRIIPIKKEIDLKTPNLKTKGIKVKIKSKK